MKDTAMRAQATWVAVAATLTLALTGCATEVPAPDGRHREPAARDPQGRFPADTTPGPTEPRPRGRRPLYEVIEVVDGDTVSVDYAGGATVRVIGIIH